MMNEHQALWVQFERKASQVIRYSMAQNVEFMGANGVHTNDWYYIVVIVVFLS